MRTTEGGLGGRTQWVEPRWHGGRTLPRSPRGTRGDGSGRTRQCTARPIASKKTAVLVQPVLAFVPACPAFLVVAARPRERLASPPRDPHARGGSLCVVVVGDANEDVLAGEPVGGVPHAGRAGEARGCGSGAKCSGSDRAAADPGRGYVGGRRGGHPGQAGERSGGARDAQERLSRPRTHEVHDPLRDRRSASGEAGALSSRRRW